MKPPKYRLCGHEHWSYEPHKFVGEIVPERAQLHPHTVVTVTMCAACAKKDAEIEGLRNQMEKLQPKPAKRDRAEYMRHFRERKRRAAKVQVA
jgi:hypothetical protein